jgi:hypothetical protein
MIQETVKATGALQIKLYGPDGKLKQEQNVKNLVVTSGKGYIAGRMVGTPTAMSHMAIGSGTADPAVGDTTLGTELGRVSLTSSAASGAVVTYVASFGAGTGTGAVTEAGIFNAGSSGTMLCRTEFAVVNKGADDSLSITWTVTVS